MALNIEFTKKEEHIYCSLQFTKSDKGFWGREAGKLVAVIHDAENPEYDGITAIISFNSSMEELDEILDALEHIVEEASKTGDLRPFVSLSGIKIPKRSILHGINPNTELSSSNVLFDWLEVITGKLSMFVSNPVHDIYSDVNHQDVNRAAAAAAVQANRMKKPDMTILGAVEGAQVKTSKAKAKK